MIGKKSLGSSDKEFALFWGLDSDTFDLYSCCLLSRLLSRGQYRSDWRNIDGIAKSIQLNEFFLSPANIVKSLSEGASLLSSLRYSWLWSWKL